MPSIERISPERRKRKRINVEGAKVSAGVGKIAKRPLKGAAASGDGPSSVTLLENQIKESQRHYNNIQTLLTIAKKDVKASQNESQAILALCRVFCRLLAEGRLSKSSVVSPNELKVLDWLKERYSDYQHLLLRMLAASELSSQRVALHSCMQLIREEVVNAGASADSVWRTASFPKFLGAMLKSDSADDICEEFLEKYVNSFDDVRHYTFNVIAQIMGDADKAESSSTIRDNGLSILSQIEPIDASAKQLDSIFAPVSGTKGIQGLSLSAHRKQGQRAWIALLGSGLDKDSRKEVLRNLTHNVVPWFQNVELLMDFLTDSYNVGGATSLLSLSGLFYLIQEKNLDYPDFFKKLYSLLDADLLYSKHRSRFFRLLNTFMSSTHLPAALVASFIKRLSRLSLDAPPAAIVAVVPWVYNLLKSHPTCTFMIHRVPRTAEERQALEETGMDDVFDMDQQDPMETGAIDSCLWELVTLQSHYHPNVASLAKIISEQFTKASYNLEDFLDYSYSSLLETELNKELKKTPVVEYEIPKKIFTMSNDDATLERLIGMVLEQQTFT